MHTNAWLFFNKENFVIKKLLATSILFSLHIHAQVPGSPDDFYIQQYASHPPYFCKYGSSSAAMAGTSLSDFDFSIFKLETKKYILIGEQVTLKGDGAYLLDKGDTTYFYDSLKGYLGKDKAGTDGNAHWRYIPQVDKSRFPHGVIWAIKNIPLQAAPPSGPVNATKLPQCSKKDVFFQERPYIAPQSTNQNLPQEAKIYYQVDSVSKAIKEATGATIQIKWSGPTSGIAAQKKVNNSSANETIPLTGFGNYPYPGGRYTFTATINDGNYESSTTLGTYETPCSSGKVISYSPHLGGPAPSSIANCGGAHCGLRQTGISGGSNPTLTFMCN